MRPTTPNSESPAPPLPTCSRSSGPRLRRAHAPTLPCNTLLAALLVVAILRSATAAIPLSRFAPYIQNFDSMGSNATAALPADFRADKQTSVRTLGSFVAAGTTTQRSGGANLTSGAGNGIYNFGSGTSSNAGPDRAVGFLSSSTGTASGNLYAQFTNSTGGSIFSLQLSYDIEKYRNGSNTNGFMVQLYYGFDGSNWFNAGPQFSTWFAPDTNNNGFATAPGATVSVTSQSLGVTVPDGAAFYLAWNYSVAAGTSATSAQALAIDNISVLASGKQWIALVANASPGSAGTMTVLSATSGNTAVQITIPGVWLTTETYAGQPFTRLEFPAMQLAGTGFPMQAGQRGWYDFPAETGYPLLPSAPYLNGLSVGIPHPLFPQSALGQTPTNAAGMQALGIDPAGARPGIPALRGFLAVAPNTTSNDLVMYVASQDGATLALPNPLIPAGFEALDGTNGFTAPQLVDQDFYRLSYTSYSGTEVPFSPVSQAGRFAATQFRVPMLQVMGPAWLRINTNTVIYLEHLKGAEEFDCPFSWDSWLFKLPFINGQALRDALTAKGLAIQASRSAHYLILTPYSYRPDLEDFARWKQSKGLTVDFAYVGTDPSDDVTPDRDAIDAYIENYFHENYCHGVYVLIVGDIDVVPSGRSSFVTSPPDMSSADSDHVYEVLGGDELASIYVGRISVNSSRELKTQLGKILSYERNPVPGNWPTHATLAANSQTPDGTTDGCFGVCPGFPSKYAAAVNAITAYSGYTGAPTFQTLHAGAASYSVARATNQNVIDAIDAGVGQVLYRGHGDENSWTYGWDGSGMSTGSGFGSSQVARLTNSVYPIVYGIACLNARLSQSDSISEVWMNSSNGSVAYFGASVESNTEENHERAKGIFRAIYESGFTRLGPALAEAERISYSATGGGVGWDNNTFAYLLLGDPELNIRKKAVKAQSPWFQTATWNLGTRITLLDPSSGSAPLPGAFVNVTLSSGSTINGFTATDGTLVLSNTPPSTIVGLDLDADGLTPATVSTRPKLTALNYDKSGFSLRLEGNPGRYQILRSTDLNSGWTNLAIVNVLTNYVDFTDTSAPQPPHALYKALGIP